MRARVHNYCVDKVEGIWGELVCDYYPVTDHGVLRLHEEETCFQQPCVSLNMTLFLLCAGFSGGGECLRRPERGKCQASGSLPVWTHWLLLCRLWLNAREGQCITCTYFPQVFSYRPDVLPFWVFFSYFQFGCLNLPVWLSWCWCTSKYVV